MNIFKKRDKSVPSFWRRFYIQMRYRLERYMIHSVVKSDTFSTEMNDKLPLISEYVNLFITIENFKSSYLGNDEFSEFLNLPNKVSLISFGDLKDKKEYAIYLECEIKDRYNTKFIFHTENVPYNDPKLLSLIRDKRLSELV